MRDPFFTKYTKYAISIFWLTNYLIDLVPVGCIWWLLDSVKTFVISGTILRKLMHISSVFRSLVSSQVLLVTVCWLPALTILSLLLLHANLVLFVGSGKLVELVLGAQTRYTYTSGSWLSTQSEDSSSWSLNWLILNYTFNVMHALWFRWSSITWANTIMFMYVILQ